MLLYLLLHPLESYARLAAMLGISKSSGHNAIERLVRSGLVHRTGRGEVAVAVGPATEFILFGAAYAFPPDLISKARGVPTGLSAPVLRSQQLADPSPMVWPSRLGEVVGLGIKPLVPGAPDIALRNPRLYHLLALVDALRVADAREREIIRVELRALLGMARA